jgi:class 3 adenylate cyclase
MVSRGWDDNVGLFVRDVLIGGIKAVEENGGEVVSFVGDAFLAVVPDPMSAGDACMAIAKDLRNMNEYIAREQRDHPNVWSFAPGGAQLKIALEIGTMEINRISSRFLGDQTLLTGTPINYAARISSAGEGSRCVLGPELAKVWPYSPLNGPFEHPGKHGLKHTFFEFDLTDVWED